MTVADAERHADSWPGTPLAERLRWVGAFRRAVWADRAALAALMADEVGKPHHEALLADLFPLLASCRWHERCARSVLRERRVAGAPLAMAATGVRVRREPLGTVGIIATWNYPVQLLGIQLVQALAAGNRVVVKPSENAPRTQARLLSLAQWAGLPAGVLTVLAPTREAGRAMLDAAGRGERPLDHVVFTGSTRVGREIAAWAARHLVPTTLELSGRDSAFVLADADPSLAAASIWAAVTMNAGQTCMAPRRALVDRRIYARFLAALAPRCAGASGGGGRGAARRLIDAPAAARCFELARQAVAMGGRSLSGVLEPPHANDPRCLTPLAVVDCPPEAPLVAGEHFGPVLAVVPVDDVAKALAIHRRAGEIDGQHLAVSIFTRSARAARELAGRFRSTAGGAATFVCINDCVLPTAHPGAGIGGHGASGWGVSRGPAGLLAMTRPVYIAQTPRSIRPPLDTPTRRTLALIERGLGWLYGRGPGGPPGAAALAPPPTSAGLADAGGPAPASMAAPLQASNHPACGAGAGHAADRTHA